MVLGRAVDREMEVIAAPTSFVIQITTAAVVDNRLGWVCVNP